MSTAFAVSARTKKISSLSFFGPREICVHIELTLSNLDWRQAQQGFHP